MGARLTRSAAALAAAVLCAGLAALSGCGITLPPQPGQGPASTSAAAPASPVERRPEDVQRLRPAQVEQIRALLARLPVKGRAPMTGYDRERFGQAWADVDRNGCDTRNDVLRRDLTEVVLKPGTHGCLVLSGVLTDPYGGGAIHFVRGPGTSTAVQIDHVVALADAWQTGAQQWPQDKRLRFANDPRELLAVAGSLNGQKGSGDAASWLPPSRSYRCRYVARQVTVKAAYGLWVTRAERDAILRVLSRCRG